MFSLKIIYSITDSKLKIIGSVVFGPMIRWPAFLVLQTVFSVDNYCNNQFLVFLKKNNGQSNECVL